MRKFVFLALVTLLSITAIFALARPTMADNGGRPFTVMMTGAEEAPGPGDPDGSGVARFRLNHGQSEVCWEISYSNIVTPTAAHIHRAPAGSPGPVVVPLSPITGGCASATRELIKEIIQNPDGFYVNVHNSVYPAGAIRGQLSRTSP